MSMRYYNELKCKNMVLNQTYVTPIFGLRCIQVVRREDCYNLLCYAINHLEFGVVFDSFQARGAEAWFRDVIEIE